MALWWKPYEPLLEAKAKPAIEVVKELLAKELVELFQSFPPAERDVQWEDASLERKFKGRLVEMPKLDIKMVDLICKVVEWDLSHENDAIDHFLRNDQHRDAAPTQDHVDAMHLLWRVVVEQLYARKDECQGLLKGKDLVDVVSEAAVRFRRAQASEN
jgi:hypothetical protein